MKIRLTKVPEEIQKRYNIAATVEGTADNSVGGGHFTLPTRDGRTVGIDAVELTGTGILVKELS